VKQLASVINQRNGICHYHYGLYAEQIKNMMDYERCSLFQLIKLLRTAKMRRYPEEKPTFVQDNNFLKYPQTAMVMAGDT